MKKDWVEIITSYLDHNNDYIQIYLKTDDEGYLLKDGGWSYLSSELAKNTA